jgi:hypothetical protein
VSKRRSYQSSSWRHSRAFVGPAILVSVGYMDPGDWATDLQAGAQLKYGLLWGWGCQQRAGLKSPISPSDQHPADLAKAWSCWRWPECIYRRSTIR